MEQNVEIYYKKDKKESCFCSWIIAAIIAIVLSFFVGVLVAATTEIIATLALGAIIALVVAFAVLLVVAIVGIICCKKSDKQKYCC